MDQDQHPPTTYNPALNICKESSGTSLEPALYVVATPIGNMEDITLRAIRILTQANIIACEDTRVTSNLLNRLGIKTPLTVYNDHSTEKDRTRIREMIMAGKSVALVSDAGTPLISDPGYKLVKELTDHHLPVIGIPGPSSVATALSISGLPTDRFLFAGFLPPKKEACRHALEELKTYDCTIVLFESANRVCATLQTLATLMPARTLAVARELTKKFEEVRRGTAASLLEHFTAHPPKGEIVLMLSPPVSEQLGKEDIEAELTAAMKTMSVKDAVTLISETHALNKKDVYKIALELKGT